MTDRRALKTVSRHIATATQEIVKRQIIAMEKDLAEIHALCTNVKLCIPFLRLVQRKDILQLRMRFDPEETKCFVLRQQPVIWLSYDWKDQKGVQSKPGSRERYIEFEWFGVKARAYFMPVSHWQDREFTFRFVGTGTPISFYSKCTLTECIPSLPRSLYSNDMPPTNYSPVVIKKHIAAVRYTRQCMESLLESFDQVADKYM